MNDLGDSIRDQISDIVWFMKGGVNWDDAWNLSFKDKESLVKTINRRNKELAGDNGKDYL